jgi:TM2 domain-containing membrane protein YozV
LAKWHVDIRGRRYGPVGQDVLRQWAIEGRVQPTDLVWSEGMVDWAPASAVPSLFDALPPPIPPQVAPRPAKSKIAAGLLGILVGSFGVHNFYLGHNDKAVAQLLITVLTCGIGAAISGLWGLVEGVLILVGTIDKDADGRPLRD